MLRLSVATNDTSSAVADLAAYVANDGTWEVFLLGPGASTSYRDRGGVWVSPAPPIAPGELLEHFTCLEPIEAERINWEAVHALASPEPQEPRPTPAQLVTAARDYRRRCDEASALRLAGILLQRFTLRTPSKGTRSSPEQDTDRNPDPSSR